MSINISRKNNWKKSIFLLYDYAPSGILLINTKRFQRPLPESGNMA